MTSADRRLRVAFAPDYSGGNPYQSLLAQALAREGIEVEMTGFRTHLPLTELSRRRGCDAVHLHWLDGMYLSPDPRRYLAKLLRTRLELACARGAAHPVFYTAHNLRSHDARFPRAELAMHRQLVRTARRTFVHSPAARDRLVAAYRLSASDAARVTEIEHGHFQHLVRDVPQDAARARLGLPPHGPVFLVFGHVRQYKSLDPLLAAFAAWREPGATLVVAGRVSEFMSAASLEAAAARDPRVRLWLRSFADDELPGLFGAADACIVPYDWQLTSGAVILAMSFGKPLLLPARDVRGERPDLSANLRADGGWAAALERFVQLSPAGRDAVAVANREAAARLSWQRSARTIAEAYREALPR